MENILMNILFGVNVFQKFNDLDFFVHYNIITITICSSFRISKK